MASHEEPSLCPAAGAGRLGLHAASCWFAGISSPMQMRTCYVAPWSCLTPGGETDAWWSSCPDPERGQTRAAGTSSLERLPVKVLGKLPSPVISCVVSEPCKAIRTHLEAVSPGLAGAGLMEPRALNALSCSRGPFLGETQVEPAESKANPVSSAAPGPTCPEVPRRPGSTSLC